MTAELLKCVLGSRSPRRIELLRLLIPEDGIEVLPPESSAEAGFEGLRDWADLENRLVEIARTKCQDVEAQLRRRYGETISEHVAAVITADTVIVATAPEGHLVVLEQPPSGDTWQETVRSWFNEYYIGRTHFAMTAFRVTTPSGLEAERLVRSEVTFHADGIQWLDWYIATGEPIGKAGGYGIQGAGGVFVSRVEGSLSNVIGLPIRELLEVLEELRIDVGCHE
jgi:septum formation protein